MPYIGKQPANVPVTADDIPNDSITAAKIVDAAITIDDIGPNAVGNSEMADDAIGLNELSATGTTNTSTFLRGDNTWAVPPDNNTVYTHPNHSGEVTSTADGAQVIADNVVDEANLKISNSPTNGQFLSAQSGNTGGLTWATVDTSTLLPLAGGTMTGNVTHSSGYLDMGSGHIYLADNAQVKFGTSEDLQIYHDGNNSYIRDAGTGDLIIKGANVVIHGTDGGKLAQFSNQTWAGLFYNNSERIRTTADGVKITGSGIDDNVIIEVSGDDDNIAPDLILKRLSSSPADNDNLGGIEWVGNHDGGGENSYAQITCRATDVSDGSEDGELRFYNATGGSMSEEMRLESGGDLHVDGDVIAYSTTVSDERLKDNIEVVDGALDKVKELKGVTFTRKQDGQESAGVIAQDVEKVLPQAVKHKTLPLQTGNDGLFKTVQYDALHALLIESIKELSTRVEELEAK